MDNGIFITIPNINRTAIRNIIIHIISGHVDVICFPYDVNAHYRMVIGIVSRYVGIAYDSIY